MKIVKQVETERLATAKVSGQGYLVGLCNNEVLEVTNSFTIRAMTGDEEDGDAEGGALIVVGKKR